MEFEDRVLINMIIEVIQMPGEDMTDGECIDEIIRILEIKYPVCSERN